MTHDELERTRRSFMQGKTSAASYWDSFVGYWSQFKNEDAYHYSDGTAAELEQEYIDNNLNN